MKKCRRIVFLLLFFAVFFLLSNSSQAMSQSLNNLYFDIKVLDNGDVNMTEIWDADLYDTNTLFKTFTINEKFKNLSDVSVAEVDAEGNVISVFQNSGTYAYHEAKNYFHATNDDSGNFEIAWGVAASGSEHRYFKISYVIERCVNVYNDCAEFYWQIIGNQWEMDTDKVSGKITLPSSVSNIDDFKVWAHGPLTGNITRDDTKTCSFEVNHMPTETFLELRIVFPTHIVSNAYYGGDTNMLENILAEEQKNADEANKQRDIAKKKSLGLAVLGAIVSVLGGFRSIKLFQKMDEKFEEANQIRGTYDFDYFRDIPNEKMSPVAAAKLACKKEDSKNNFSSIMMSLTEKNWIMITPGEKKESTIIDLNLTEEEGAPKSDETAHNEVEDKPIFDSKKRGDLTDDEQRVLDYLVKVGKRFSLKDFEKYTSKHPESFYNLLNKISKIASESIEKKFKYIDTKNREVRGDVESTKTSLVVWMVLLPIVLIFILAEIPWNYAKVVIGVAGVIELMFLYGVFRASGLSKKIPKYTEEGTEEKAKWEGLKKFMEDFSLIDEREIPELALWEKYLVYATAFGIADKVMKQLKTRFPELNDTSYVNSHYAVMHMASNSNMYSSSFNKSVSAAEAYHAREVASSSYSSGSGGGGGFSSGGGGGRRRRWRRWPLNNKNE